VRVLAIDDDYQFLEAVSEALEDAGFKVHPASDGDEALRTLSRTGTGRFDAVLLDLALPTMGGDEVARRIRTRPDGADVPIVLLTSFIDDQRIAEVLQLSGTYYVSKTGPLHALLELTHEVVSLARSRQGAEA
jgi:CheY-like chemotaxis protein